MSAPSFSSFPDLDLGPSTSTASRAEKVSKDKRRRKHDSRKDVDGGKSKKRKNEARNNRHAEQSEDFGGFTDEVHKAQEDMSRSEKPQDTAPIFYSDRRGDPSNVIYGYLHAGDIAKYRLVGGGRTILGLPKGWVASHRTAKGVEIGVAGHRRRGPELVDPKARILLDSVPTRRLLRSDKEYKYKEVDGVLRLPSGRCRKNNRLYRSITNEKETSDSDSSASDDATSNDNADEAELSAHQETLRDLEQRLSSDPSSISSWTSLLRHTLSTIPLTSRNATKARSDITLSILSRALSAHPDNSMSKVLRLQYLRAGEEIWHDSKLRAEWEDALKVGGIDVWMEWLEWRIRKAANGIDGITEDVRRIYGGLDTNEDGEIAKVRVFWRVALVFHNAGYVERCISMFQAQAELTFALSHDLYDAPMDARLDALEEFWEAEVPRIGELDAPGFLSWKASDNLNISPPHISNSMIPPTAQDVSDPYHRWATLESFADRTLRLATRSTSENFDEADPYSTVLFSDIRPLLLSLRSSLGRNAFRLAFLSVLGLHVPGFSASLGKGHDDTDMKWSNTYLTIPEHMSSLFPSCSTQRRITADAQAGVLIGREREYAHVFGPVRNWRLGVLGPLEQLDGRKAGLWDKVDVEGTGPDPTFVRRLFERLRLGGDDYEWDALALAFEAAINVKSALKLSRSFLSGAPDSLAHWQNHARLERLCGRLDGARKVYETVLIATPHAPIAPFVGLLWWDWAEMEWLEGKSDAAVQVILHVGGVTGSGSMAILRAKRNLEDMLRSTESARWKEREAWVNLRALLELLTSTVDAALGIYDVHLSDGANLVANESLTVASLLMIYRYGALLRNPMAPSVLRDRVSTALELYPSNTIVLGLFLHAEKGQGVWGRVRGILGESTATGAYGGKDLARRVAELWVAQWERGRWEAETERTRGGLAAAVLDDRTKGSAILWRIYLEFEIRLGELQRAKNLLYRALGECPLNKELYLLAFGPLRNVFQPHELNAFADVMAERQIRMRTGLDALLEASETLQAPSHNADSESSDNESDIERNARELRRLMPY